MPMSSLALGKRTKTIYLTLKVRDKIHFFKIYKYIPLSSPV